MRATRLAVVGVLALGAGALATFWVAQTLPTATAPGEPRTAVKVVTTRTAVAAGQALQASDLQLVAWAGPVAPQQAHTQLRDVVGRVTRQALPADDLVLEPKLAAADTRAGLAAAIELGKRAISVRVNDVVGVAGFALPGSYVDVLVSARDGSGQSFSKIVLERVKVLAAAQDTQADPQRPKVVNAVTLELAPNEAETLDLARAIGHLSLVLRNESDVGRSPGGGVRVTDLAAPGAPSPRVAAAPPNRPRAAVSPERERVIPPASLPPTPNTAGSGRITEMRGLATVERQP